MHVAELSSRERSSFVSFLVSVLSHNLAYTSENKSYQGAASTDHPVVERHSTDVSVPRQRAGVNFTACILHLQPFDPP